MIRYILTGSILDDDADALVNPVNCVGVAGKGLARAFRNRFPLAHQAYLALSLDPMPFLPGTVRTNLFMRDDHRVMVHFATKDHWRNTSRLEWIQSGLSGPEGLVSLVRAFEFNSIAIPAIGCGLGGLKWDAVRPLIETAFVALPDVDVRVYPPKGEG